MTRLIVSLAAIAALALPVAAQDPVVDVIFFETSTIPGQPLTLRVTVLVPTWMPTPPVFPSFEAPNLLVQLPQGASGPTSRTINGETWSGVARRYRITPMVPGRFEVSGQAVTITWADPGQTDPLQKTVMLDTIVVEGVVPEGAEGLDPFLAAEALTLSREMAETPMPLSAGDSLSLTVTAKIEGTSSMFLPPLVPGVTIEGVALYPSEPVLEDSDNRGKRAGRRTEEITLVAESGGAGTFPDIAVSWYNLSSGKVETATVEGFAIAVDAPKAASTAVSGREIAAYAVLSLVVFGLGAGLWRVFAPRLRSWRADRRARYEASEAWAYASVKEAMRLRDMGRLFTAVDVWAARASIDPREETELASALCALGALRYGQAQGAETKAWAAVRAAFEATRKKTRTRRSADLTLPPLNPGLRRSRGH